MNRIPESIQPDLTALLAAFTASSFAPNIKKIILFGSFAKNTHQPDSDLDIALIVREKPRAALCAEYALITDIAERNTDLILCTEEQLMSGKYVYSEILRNGVVLYDNI
jgi:predicted nucleotidyltransferase